MNINIFKDDCIGQENRFKSESVNLGIFDPPFGIGESQFNKHYKRNSDKIIEGYKEAPNDYEMFTYNWMKEAVRLLHPNGSMYIIMGHSNLRHLLNAAYVLDLHEINHIIWKFNFGVNTTRKFVTSHYHILYYSKSKKNKVTFNTNCRFGSQEKNLQGSCLYSDLEDVFRINKDYAPGKSKNQNKLPEELIKKLILYSSNKNDMVCDFFQGNFTTAYTALKLGRRVCGYEINEIAYNYHMPKLNEIIFGCDLPHLKIVKNITPENKGKSISLEESINIYNDYKKMVKSGISKGDAAISIQKTYKRGRFSIKNILDKCKEDEYKKDELESIHHITDERMVEIVLTDRRLNSESLHLEKCEDCEDKYWKLFNDRKIL